MTQKDFLKKYGQFKIATQHLETFDGCYKVQVYNTTYDMIHPVFEHIILEYDMDNLLVDYDTIILTPILNWIEECENNRRICNE